MITLRDSSFVYFYELVNEKPCKVCELLFADSEVGGTYCALPEGETCQAVLKYYKQVKVEIYRGQK